jgi:hypothetical protein
MRKEFNFIESENINLLAEVRELKEEREAKEKEVTEQFRVLNE